MGGEHRCIDSRYRHEKVVESVPRRDPQGGIEQTETVDRRSVREAGQVQRRTPLAARQDEGPQGRTEYPQHPLLALRHEAARLAERPEEPHVVVAVVDANASRRRVPGRYNAPTPSPTQPAGLDGRGRLAREAPQAVPGNHATPRAMPRTGTRSVPHDPGRSGRPTRSARERLPQGRAPPVRHPGAPRVQPLPSTRVRAARVARRDRLSQADAA